MTYRGGARTFFNVKEFVREQSELKKKMAKGRLVPAVDRAARILALIEAGARPMSITDISRQMDVSKGTIREILETLRGHGLLERDADSKLYRLGPQLVRLGTSSREGKDLVGVARPYLTALCEEQREIVLLLVPQENRLFIQEVFEPSDPRMPIIVAASPGRSIPNTAGACGKVLVAWSNEKARAELLAQADRPVKFKPAELKQIRSQGYAVDNEEFIEGIRGISAPVLGANGQVLALILLSSIVASLSLDRFEEVGLAVNAVAGQISQALGGSGVFGLEDESPNSPELKSAS